MGRRGRERRGEGDREATCTNRVLETWNTVDPVFLTLDMQPVRKQQPVLVFPREGSPYPLQLDSTNRSQKFSKQIRGIDSSVDGRTAM